MEYSQLVDRILDAERGAQEIAAEVRRREAAIEDELNRETARLQESAKVHARERVEAITRETAAARDAAIQAQDRRKAEALERMEEAYRRCGDSWVDTLLRRVAGEEP